MQNVDARTSPTQALAALVVGRAAMLGLWAALPPSPSPLLLWGCIGLDTVVLLWQLLMVRLAMRASGPSAWTYLMALLAIVAVAMVGASGLNHLSRAWLRPVPLIAAPQPLRMDGTIAYLNGPIDFDTFEAMKKTLALDPAPTALHLSSNGGRIGAARGVARLIREAGLDTHVTATCASACTLVFAAGARRSISPRGRLGFHSYQLQSGVQTVSASDEATRDRADLAARGISAAFLAQAYATPANDMWFPTHPQLRAAGVLRD